MEHDDQPKAVLWLLIIIALAVLSGSIYYFGRKNSDIITELPTVTPRATREPRTYIVSYRAGVFSPTNIRIHVGDTVEFINDGNAQLLIVADGNSALVGFDSNQTIPPRGQYIYVFTKAGIFDYLNDLRETERGTVTVRQ